MDTQGKSVLKMENIQPTITYTVDVSKLAKGVYMLKLKNSSKEFVQKVVIK